MIQTHRLRGRYWLRGAQPVQEGNASLSAHLSDRVVLAHPVEPLFAIVAEDVIVDLPRGRDRNLFSHQDRMPQLVAGLVQKTPYRARQHMAVAQIFQLET